MLIGTMLLHVLELFEKVDAQLRDDDHKLLRNDSEELPNLGMVLALFLVFVEDQKETCRLNEDGWKYLIVKKADQVGIEIRGENLGTKIRDQKRAGDIVERVRNSPEYDAQPEDMDIVEAMTHMTGCYKREEMWGILTVEMFNRGTERSWTKSDYFMEVCWWIFFESLPVGRLTH